MGAQAGMPMFLLASLNASYERAALPASASTILEFSRLKACWAQRQECLCSCWRH
jgi:hypothetical protein